MQIKADIVGNFIVSVKAKDSSDIIGTFNLKCDVEPGLYYGATDSDPSNDKVHLSNTLTVNLNSEKTVRMWLYDGTRYSEVVSDDLSALAGLEIKGVNETAGGKPVNKVSFYSEIAGDYSVQYKKNNNYSISVNISLPSIGLYKNSQLDGNGIVNNIIGYSTDHTFYLLPCSENFVVNNIKIKGWKSGAETVLGTDDYVFKTNDNSLKIVNRDFDSYAIYVNDNEEIINIINTYYLGQINYNGQQVTFGLTDKGTDNNLHIANGSTGPAESFDMPMDLYLAAGVTQGAAAEIAEKALIDAITNVKFSVVKNTFKDDSFSVTETGKISNIYENDLYGVQLYIKANSAGSAIVKTEFDLDFGNGNVKKMETYYFVRRYQSKQVEITIDETNFSDLSTMLSSYDNLKAMNQNTDFVNANRITVFLPEGETFTGKLNIDMSGYNQDGAYKQFSLVCPEREGFNIDGTLEINGGFVNIHGINFTAKDDVTTSYNDAFGGNAKIGVIAYDSNGEVNCGGFIFNSTFTGYDYGVMSTYKGLVADVDGSVFDDCGYGIYMDCHSQNLNIGGDGSKDNTFVNCTKSAVAIISTPGQLPPYSLRFTENYFYNNTGTGSDFMLFNTEGVYYFQNNYYGKAPNVFTMDNLRTVNINYGNTQYSQVVTNPCIRYLGSEYPLGIDPAEGLYTRIFSGQGTVINGADLANLRLLEISNNDGNGSLGRFKFGA